MNDMTDEQIEKKIVELLSGGKMKVKAVSKSIEAEKKKVDEVIVKMAKDDKIEYLYLDTSYVQLKGK